jgi:cysteine desulfurase
MMPYLTRHHGNPSSSHSCGATVKDAVSRARAQVATLIEAKTEEIVFTSGGSESNNHVLKGVAWTRRRQGDHIITSAIEHPAIHVPCNYLQQNGFRITKVPVDQTGLVDPRDVRNAITSRTILISIMHANNEVGTIQPIAEIATIAREAGIWFHTDAAQSVGKISTKVNDLGVDFLSLAGHKCYAPQGIGALYIRSGIEIEPLIHGAGHESGRRSGTEAVHNIVALGAAAELAKNDDWCAKSRSQCAKLHNLLSEAFGDRLVLNGPAERRLPNTLNVSFRGLNGADILTRLDNICASTGSACHADEDDPSPVLAAMGIPKDIALGAIRFSLGRSTTDAEIDLAAAQVIETVRAM